MNISDFVFLRDPAGKAGECILLTLQPWALIEVWNFPTLEAATIFAGDNHNMGLTHIPGYMMTLRFAGTLDRRLVRVEDRARILQQARDFFIDNRLDKAPGRYKRYQIPGYAF